MKQFAGILKEATKNISEEYFQLPVAGKEDPIYRERVYCYELYHQLRAIWPKEWAYSLSGEIDKNGHPLIRNNGLDSTKPDFLIHVPGRMDQNILVMEVKPINAENAGIRKDLITLTAFCEFGEYQRAIYLIYGNSNEGFLKIKDTALSLQNQDQDGRIDLQLIELWYHSFPGYEAELFDWEEGL